MSKQIKGILGTKLGMTQVFNDAGQIVPVTSTCCPLANTSAVTSCPSVYSDASSVRSSARYRRGVRPAFANTPLTGLVTLRGSISP